MSDVFQMFEVKRCLRCNGVPKLQMTPGVVASDTTFYVECSNCHGRTQGAFTQEDAVAWWNHVMKPPYLQDVTTQKQGDNTQKVGDE